MMKLGPTPEQRAEWARAEYYSLNSMYRIHRRLGLEKPEWPMNFLSCIFLKPVTEITYIPPMDAIRRAIESLNHAKHETILYRRFRDGMTLPAAGAETGISSERARQVQQLALRRLRHPTRKRMLTEINKE